MKGIKRSNLAGIFACIFLVGCGGGSPTSQNKPVGAGGTSGSNPQDETNTKASKQAADLGNRAK